MLPYSFSVTPCLAELQSQTTGMVWEYKARWHFPGQKQDNAEPTTPCPHHSAQQLQPPFTSFPNAAARWERNPETAAQDTQHEVAFSALQKAPAKYPGTCRTGASQCLWSISVPSVTQDTVDGEDHPSMQPPSMWEHRCQVTCSRQQRSAADGIPAFLGNHARWFKANSIICWQSKAVNHLLHINTPPWTRQPPAPFCASFPLRNPNQYWYESPIR